MSNLVSADVRECKRRKTSEEEQLRALDRELQREEQIARELER